MGNVENITLKMRKSDLESVLDRLIVHSNELDAKVMRFQEFKTKADEFVGERDMNFENVMSSIDTNISECRKTHKTVITAIEKVQGIIKDMEDFAGNSKQIFVNVKETTENVTKILGDSVSELLSKI